MRGSDGRPAKRPAKIGCPKRGRSGCAARLHGLWLSGCPRRGRAGSIRPCKSVNKIREAVPGAAGRVLDLVGWGGLGCGMMAVA